MKHLFSFIIFCFISSLTYSQLDSNFVFKKLSQNDSLNFNPFWQQFNSFITKEDTSKIRLHSLQTLNCDICNHANNQYTSIDSVLVNNFLNIKTSQLFKAIQQKRITLTKRQQQNSDTTITPEKYGEILTTYEVWIQTYLPNEFASGHEGQSHCFQFIKYNGHFKLFGITSIP